MVMYDTREPAESGRNVLQTSGTPLAPPFKNGHPRSACFHVAKNVVRRPRPRFRKLRNEAKKYIVFNGCPSGHERETEKAKEV
jgi:hypothetical protein